MPQSSTASQATTVLVSKHDLWELSTLSAVRALVDKLLIHCLRDTGLNHFFQSVDLAGIKRAHAERILGAIRYARGMEDVVCSRLDLSLPVHEQLEEGNLASLHSHLVSAVLELLGELTRAPSRQVGQAIVDLLIRADPKLIPGLLPSGLERRVPHSAPDVEGKQHCNFLGTKVAPMHVPIPRRIQVFACAIVTYIPLLVFAFYALCAYEIQFAWPFVVLYPLYVLRSGTASDTALWPTLRKNWLLQNCAAYFPAALFKSDPTVAWDASKAYLIGYHPHGVSGFGAALGFGTDVLGWKEKFPRLEPRLATVFMNIRIPLLWELIARMGAVPGSSTSLSKAVRPGRAVIVNVGGRDEFLDSSPGQCVLTVRPRKEFFRLALRHGAMLVPAFGFGENELFLKSEKVPGFLRQIQMLVESWFGISLPLFNGRGIFTYNLGPMPFRRKLSVVVGSPMHVQQSKEEPSDTQVEELQETYIGALRSLFEEWRPKCEPEDESQLIIV